LDWRLILPPTVRYRVKLTNGDIKEGAVTIYNFKDGAWVPL